MALLTIADPSELAGIAAGHLAASLTDAMALHGVAMLALTGGTTPRAMYETLAAPAWRGRIDWSRVHVFWGDERHVPPDHAESNYGMARDALLRHVDVPPAQVHRMRGEVDPPEAAARDYEQELVDSFTAAGRRPCTFDVMLLGMGEDAHVASVFPGSDLLASNGRAALAGRVAAVRAAHLDTWRITLTPDALRDAHEVMMLVSGATKADAMFAAIEAPLDVARYPVQLLREMDARVRWFIDRPAAARLPAAPPA